MKFCTTLAFVALSLLAACDSVAPLPEGPVVTFAFEGRSDSMRVVITHAATLAQAEAFLANGGDRIFPIGPIVRGAGIDARYPFHFLPDSVRLAEVAIEVCDGAPMKTAKAVDDFIEGATGNRNSPRATYCPWGAYPVKVER